MQDATSNHANLIRLLQNNKLGEMQDSSQLALSLEVDEQLKNQRNMSSQRPSIPQNNLNSQKKMYLEDFNINIRKNDLTKMQGPDCFESSIENDPFIQKFNEMKKPTDTARQENLKARESHDNIALQDYIKVQQDVAQENTAQMDTRKKRPKRQKVNAEEFFNKLNNKRDILKFKTNDRSCVEMGPPKSLEDVTFLAMCTKSKRNNFTAVGQDMDISLSGGIKNASSNMSNNLDKSQSTQADSTLSHFGQLNLSASGMCLNGGVNPAKQSQSCGINGSGIQSILNSSIANSVNSSYNLFINNDPAAFMKHHGITEMHRIRMVDWMLQVFRVLNKKSPRTYVLATQILDMYFRVKRDSGIKMEKNELHLTGLVSVFLASKFEDSRPIKMNQLIKDAAHGKFTAEQILEREKDVLQTLGCKIYINHYYDEACASLKQFLYENKDLIITKKNQDELFRFLGFISQIVVHSIDLLYSCQKEDIVSAIIWLTLKYFKNLQKSDIVNNLEEAIEFSQEGDDFEISNVGNTLFQRFKQQLIKEYGASFSHIKSLKLRIQLFYLDFQKNWPTLKNLYKNYPEYYSQEYLDLFKNI
eukprot:403339923